MDKDVMDLIGYLLTPTAQVAIIIGLAELIKKAGMDSKYIPIVDVVLGIISGIGVYGFAMGYGTVNGIMLGLALGLSACGLFSGVKNLTEDRAKGV